MNSPRQTTSAAVPLPSMVEEPPQLQDLVVVASFQSPVEAGLALSRLHGSGLQAFLRDENTMQVQPFWSLALGGVKVVVAVEDAEEARLLLDVPPPGSMVDEGLDGEEAMSIPTEKDALALRAWRAAILGFVAPVAFHAYSIYLLVAFARAKGSASPSSRRRAFGSLVVNTGVMGVAWMAFSHGW